MDDADNAHDYSSIFGHSSDYDFHSRSASPQDQPMDDSFDVPMQHLNDDSVDGLQSLDQPPIVSLTLSDFVSKAQDLHTSDMADFCKFVLTGIHEGTQYQLDPIKDELRHHHRVQALRDFDSMLGLHRDICVDTYLAMYPIPKYTDTLRRNIHIKYNFSNRKVCSSTVFIFGV